MIPHRPWLPALALALLSACGVERAPAPSAVKTLAAWPVAISEPEPPADAQARAQAAMKDFSERLRGQLREAMSRDGAPGAVDFCHEQAPRIAVQVMAEHGVRLGRMAVPGRNRNPANAASGWQAELLESFQQAVDTGGAPESQSAVFRDQVPPGIELRMARGIRVEAACLMCHGDNIAPELAARIAEHYPDDRATGFREGDLRGLIWAEVPTRAEPEQ